jgi:hypothetical protein
MVARFESVEKDMMAEMLERLATVMMLEMLVLVDLQFRLLPLG